MAHWTALQEMKSGCKQFLVECGLNNRATFIFFILKSHSKNIGFNIFAGFCFSATSVFFATLCSDFIWDKFSKHLEMVAQKHSIHELLDHDFRMDKSFDNWRVIVGNLMFYGIILIYVVFSY